ncbi:unnamed protein product, partial [Symbiodinium sp. KB8]
MPSSLQEGTQSTITLSLTSTPYATIGPITVTPASVTLDLLIPSGICLPPADSNPSGTCSNAFAAPTFCNSDEDCSSGAGRCVVDSLLAISSPTRITWASANSTMPVPIAMQVINDNFAESATVVPVNVRVVTSSYAGFVDGSVVATTTLTIPQSDASSVSMSWGFGTPWAAADGSTGVLVPEGSTGTLTVALASAPLVPAAFILDVATDSRVSLTGAGLSLLQNSAGNRRYLLPVVGTSAALTMNVADNRLDEPRLVPLAITASIGATPALCGFLEEVKGRGYTSSGSFVQPAWTPATAATHLVVADNE